MKAGDPGDKRNLPSPFRRILATGFYDGPTEGFAVSADDDALYFFHMLDWDDGQDLRVFSIAAVSDVSVDEMVTLLSSAESPTWPIWVVPTPLNDVAEQFIEQTRKGARPVAIVAARNLLRTLEVWRPIDESYLLTGKQDWLTSLGLPRYGDG